MTTFHFDQSPQLNLDLNICEGCGEVIEGNIWLDGKKQYHKPCFHVAQTEKKICARGGCNRRVTTPFYGEHKHIIFCSSRCRFWGTGGQVKL